MPASIGLLHCNLDHGMLASAAGDAGVAGGAVRAQDALQCLRRALHEAGEEEVGRAGAAGARWAVWALQQCWPWPGIRYSGSLPMSSMPRLSLRSPCALVENCLFRLPRLQGLVSHAVHTVQ